jgi:hypothetical protein
MAFVGTRALFESADFAKVDDTRSVSDGFPRVVMRLALQPPSSARTSLAAPPKEDAMEPSTGPGTPEGVQGKSNEALAADLVKLRNSLTTPEVVGRTLANFVLTEAITNGTQTDANTFELPMVVTTKVERRDTDSSTQVCTHHSISVLGVEVVAWDSCTTTTTTS